MSNQTFTRQTLLQEITAYRDAYWKGQISIESYYALVDSATACYIVK
jgi:hypothetical protein